MIRHRRLLFVASAFTAAGCASSNDDGTSTRSPSHRRSGFESPERAVDAFAASVVDPTRAEECLGPGGFQTLACCDDGDLASDDAELERVRALVDECVAIADAGPDACVIFIGNEEWELPAPLVRTGAEGTGGWRFDLDAGREEMLCRTIGWNELRAIATLRELGAAQVEFRELTDDAAYAMKWKSEPGRRDGLYWESAEGVPTSPLGPLFCTDAVADCEDRDPACSVPCHGYSFRILTRQGAHAEGGEKDYLDSEGRMTRGFAFVAWPVEYRKDGVMTFLSSDDGGVYEKDLGSATAEEAAALVAFDPDPSWTIVTD